MITALMLCAVVSVQDGDTITVQCEAGIVKVRIAEIDAPEGSQPFGDESRRRVVDLCLGTVAQVEARGKDRYGRTIAAVQCRAQDVGHVMVRDGLAWAYRKYMTDETLLTDEAAAKKSHVGLWQSESPIAPWDWRRMKRD